MTENTYAASFDLKIPNYLKHKFNRQQKLTILSKKTSKNVPTRVKNASSNLRVKSFAGVKSLPINFILNIKGKFFL